MNTALFLMVAVVLACGLVFLLAVFISFKSLMDDLEKREPLLCQNCGADLGEQPIRNTSKGCLINCGRCGAAHEYTREDEA